MRIFGRLFGHGLFKGLALIGGIALIVLVWLYDASFLTRAADANLWLVKQGASLLPASAASKTEAALRMFGIDRALLFTEGVALVKLIMLAVSRPFHRTVQ